MDNPVYIVIGLLVLIVIVLLWHVVRPRPIILTPRAETLRTWVAEQLQELTDDQKEAVELFCQAQQTSWNNIHRKETADAVQS